MNILKILGKKHALEVDHLDNNNGYKQYLHNPTKNNQI